MRSSKPEVKILDNSEEVAREAAGEIMGLAREAHRVKGLFTLVLSGGSTPQGLYTLLASDASFRAQLPWERIHFFWGDERQLPPEHPESNYRMANEAMLARVPVSPSNVHRIKGENPNANQAADEYEETLRNFFCLKAGAFPRFDLVLLGMGSDGHTASLFPGTPALKEQNRLVVAHWVARLNAQRITMTLPVINHAACVIFLVSGEEKAETLRTVLEGEAQPEPLPAQRVQPIKGRCMWFIDRAAARFLKNYLATESPENCTPVFSPSFGGGGRVRGR